MSDGRFSDEKRLHRAAVTNAHRQAPEPEQPQDGADEEEDVQGRTMEQRALWLDAQIRDAMARGEFENLPGAGRPIPGLDRPHDPDWWVKRLIERENITGVLPPALALRKEDAALTERIDEQITEADVRRVLEDFNARVVDARRQLLGGPPVITPTRDVDAELAAWRERRERRLAERRAARRTPAKSARRRWWRRGQ
jgi:hypothetical protein